MGRTLQEILMARDTLIFLLQHLGFVINLKKSVLHPARISGLSNRYRENNFGSFREKIKACVSMMSRDFHAAKNFSVKSHKINWSAVIICPGSFTSRNPVSISSTGTNINSTEKRSLRVIVTLGNLTRDELLWWIENLKLCNGRKQQQRESHMTIHRDALTKGLGAYCKGVSTRGKWSKEKKHFQINVLELLA